MKKLGISVYPQHAPIEKIIEYIKTASELGYQRIFTCLISANENDLNDFKLMCRIANQLGMEVISDVNPDVIKQLDIKYTDLKFFHELGLSGIRMDMGYSGFEESVMSYNPYGLKIELNMSMGNQYIDNLISYQPNISQICACHNFYPSRYTGLSIDHFIQTSEQYKKFNLRTAAFVDAKSASIGPWPVSNGLCTIESHRSLPIDVQAKELIATRLIDDIIIANMFASKEELTSLAQLNKDLIEFNIILEKGVDDLHQDLIFNSVHFNRGDISEYVIRSTEPRVTKYKNIEFKPFNTVQVFPGDVIVENLTYPRYSGELKIALKPFKNPGNLNVVGHINYEEMHLLKYIKPWTRFIFKQK